MDKIRFPRTILLFLMIMIGSSQGCDQINGSANGDNYNLKEMAGGVVDLRTASQQGLSWKANIPHKVIFHRITRSLSYGELHQISGEGGTTTGHYFKGKLSNGNKDLSITEVTIEVDSGLPDRKLGKIPTKVYDITINLPPMTRGPFGFSMTRGPDGTKYNWRIVGAKGFETNPPRNQDFLNL